MESNGQITILQLILLAMTALGLNIHVLIIDPLISAAGRDAWISLIGVLFISLIWILLLLYISKGTKQEHIAQWLKKHIGAFGSAIFSFLFFVLIIILAAITLKDTISWAKVTFLENTPAIVLYLTYLILCLSAAAGGLQTIAIANFFILFVVVILGFFVSFTNIQFKDPSLFFPIMEHGYLPVIKGMIFPLSGMTELIIFIILQHRIQGQIKYKHFFTIALILFWLSLGPTTGAIMEFGPVEAKNQLFSAYEQWGLASLGKFVEHLDFFSIYQWLSGVFIRVSLIYVAAIEYYRPKKTSRKYGLLSFMTIIILGLCLLPISNITFYIWLETFIIPFLFYYIASLTLFLFIIVFFSKRRGKLQ